MIKEFLKLFSEWQMELEEEELREESVARISNGHVSNAVKLSKIRTEGFCFMVTSFWLAREDFVKSVDKSAKKKAI